MGYAAVENHYGDNYVARVDSEQDIEDIMQTCEICCDSDWVIGVYDNEEEAKEHIYD
ncbi:hypothetical protein FM131_04590 [Weissella confusa]|nr:hypothetical protein [Weissella confusa]SJX68663.1 hypothetical protein FM131_04590 [Weissella confusa]